MEDTSDQFAKFLYSFGTRHIRNGNFVPNEKIKHRRITVIYTKYQKAKNLILNLIAIKSYIIKQKLKFQLELQR